MRLTAYLRVSTDRQAEEGLGLEVQRETIKAWAREQGHRIILWTSDEGVSGSNGLDQRVGLLDAIASLQSAASQGLVVYRLDRLARDLNLQEQLLAEVWRMGCRVFSTSASEDAYLDPEGAADDPSRTMIRQILGAVAQYERAMIRLRLRSGKARKAALGGYVGGGIPLGYRAEGRELVPDDAELRTRERIIQLRTEGLSSDHELVTLGVLPARAPLSLRAVAVALDAEGLRPKRGGPWHPETIRQALSRPPRR